MHNPAQFLSIATDNETPPLQPPAHSTTPPEQFLNIVAAPADYQGACHVEKGEASAQPNRSGWPCPLHWP